LLQRFCVGQRIYPWRSLGGDEHMNLYTIFQCAQLLERLSTFEPSGFPLHELQEGVPTKTVDALMTKGQEAALFLFGGLNTATPWRLEWNGDAREIEGVSSKIDNHFNLVRGQRVLWMFKPMRGSDDLSSAVRAKFLNDLVD
jgi:hypothetical protein